MEVYHKLLGFKKRGLLFRQLSGNLHSAFLAVVGDLSMVN